MAVRFFHVIFCVGLVYGVMIAVDAAILIPPPSYILSDVNSPAKFLFRTEKEPEFAGPTTSCTEPLNTRLAVGKCIVVDEPRHVCNTSDVNNFTSVTIQKCLREDAGTYVARDNNGKGDKAFTELVLLGNHTRPFNNSHAQVTWNLCGNAQLSITCSWSTGQTATEVCERWKGDVAALCTNCKQLIPHELDVTCSLGLIIFHKCNHTNSTINWIENAFSEESETSVTTIHSLQYTDMQTSTFTAEATTFNSQDKNTLSSTAVGLIVGVLSVIILVVGIVAGILIYCHRTKRHQAREEVPLNN